MKYFSLIALFICSCFSYGESKVTSTVEYSDVFSTIREMGQEYGQENVLVVFDIDDTLLVIDECKGPNGERIKGLGKLFSCPSEHTEKKLSGEIKNIQSEGFATIALTARGNNLISATQRELKRLHDGLFVFNFEGRPFVVDFDQILVPKTKKCKKGELAPCLSGSYSNRPKFIDGVMYANGANKGLALESLLKELKVSFSGIVFIDDRSKNTKNVNEVYKNKDGVDVEVFLYLSDQTPKN